MAKAFDSRTHFIHSQTHNGTHVETPYNYDENGADVGSMSVESYTCQAVVCDMSHSGGRGGSGPGQPPRWASLPSKHASAPASQAVRPEDLGEAGVGTGDIVLLRGCDLTVEDQPYLTFESIDWLIRVGIKALGVENVRCSIPSLTSTFQVYGPN